MDDVARRALHARLERSAFMRYLGGAGFGGISWLLAGGLLIVDMGSTWNQAEPNLPLVNTRMVVAGWVLVVAAVVLGILYLTRLVRFLRDVRIWTVAEVAHRRGIFTPPSTLEDKLSRRSVFEGMGPSVVLAFGAALMPPCGLVMAPIVLLVLAIMSSDAHSGHITLSTLDRVEMVFAAIAAVFITSIFVLVLAGFQKAANRFRRL